MKRKNKVFDLGNNESLSKGVFPQSDGSFLGLTLSKSKYFKTRKGAERFVEGR